VRFTREISGSSELFVEGRGHREEIDIFPGRPCNNKLAGNVVDLCPVGALLDKDFLFKQRVWLLQSTPSISPVDSGGENIYLDHNEGVVYRIRARINHDVNEWWISDDTRYSYKVITDAKRLKQAMHKEHGAPVAGPFAKALEEAVAGLKKAAESGDGSLYAVMSPMMSCEEAWLLGRFIRSLDSRALLVLGPAPTTGQNEVFKNSLTGKQTFVIQGEKVPNAAGIRRVLALLGGPTATFDELFSRPETAGAGEGLPRIAGHFTQRSRRWRGYCSTRGILGRKGRMLGKLRGEGAGVLRRHRTAGRGAARGRRLPVAAGRNRNVSGRRRPCTDGRALC
jgi:NADH-quinone oxidoreductase subunit G